MAFASSAYEAGAGSDGASGGSSTGTLAEESEKSAILDGARPLLADVAVDDRAHRAVPALPVAAEVIPALLRAAGLEVRHQPLVAEAREALEHGVDVVATEVQLELRLVDAP